MMLIKLSESIYLHTRSNRYYNVIEILSELQIQLSLIEISLIDKEERYFSILTSIMQPISLVMNLRSPKLEDYFMDNYITIWIINLILFIYLIVPLCVLFSFIQTKYTIVPKITYLWLSYFGYVHLYIISYIIHSWLIYQLQKSSFNNIKNAIFAGFSVILIIINIIISIFICKVYISRVYLPGFIGHKSRYNKWMNLIFKLAFPISQSFEPSSIRNVIFLVILIIWSILRQVNFVFINPYYNYNTTRIMSYMQGITLGIIISISIVFLIQTRVENASNICGLLLFFTSSFSSKCFMLFSEKKVNELLHKIEKINDIDYATQYCLIDHFTYNVQRKEIIRKNTKQNELISNELLFSHRMKCNECHGKESFQSIRSHLLATKIFEGLNIHKHSFILNCLALNFYLYEKQDPYRSCFLLEKLKRKSLAIEDKLILKAYEAKIQELLYITRNNVNIDCSSFAACENFYNEFLCSVKHAIETYIKLWSEINSPMPNLLNLIKFAVKIRQAHKKFKKQLLLYQTKFINNFAKPLLLTGLYYNILKNNENESYFILQKYQKFKLRNSNADIAKDNISSRNNINIRISGSDDSLGNVISCSGNITEIINLNAGRIIGKNVAQILPSFFQQHHNDFIRHYKETGIGNVIDKINYQFCQHEYGHLIPVNASMSIYPILDSGLTFLGIMKVIKTCYEYILINQDGQIEGMTLGISNDLNFKSNHKINFCSLLYFNRPNPYIGSNIEPDITPKSNTQSLIASQFENFSSNQLLNKPTGNSPNTKNESQILSRFLHQSTYLFQNFLDDYFKDCFYRGKRLILKRISNNNNQKFIYDNIINPECYEYKTWLEKHSYKFGLQLYIIKLRKINNIQNKLYLKSDNSKIALKKTSIDADIISIEDIEKDKQETNALLDNQPFIKKPEFRRESIYDSNNKASFLIKKKVSYAVKLQTEDKMSSLSINSYRPKIINLFESNSKFQEEITQRKETYTSRDELYIPTNKDQSYSVKNVYSIDNKKIKSQFQKKKEKKPSYLFKFRSTFLEMNTNLMIILFLISIISIFIMYSISIIHISDVNTSLMITYYCNQRLASLIEVDKGLRNIWLIKANIMSDKRLEWNNISSQSANSLKIAYESSQYLIGNNSLILKEIQNIDIEFQNEFYSPVVTLYNVDKSGQILSTYTKSNSFIAGYQIYQVVSKIKKLSLLQITMNTTELIFLLRNILNDIYIEYERSAYILGNEINSSIDSIKETILIIFLIILIISIICITLLLPGLRSLFLKKKSLLMQIVDINIQYCQSHIYRINQFYKGLQESYSDGEFFKIYEGNEVIESNNECKNNTGRHNKKSNISNKRMANTFGIKLDFAKSFSILLALSAIYIVIFYIKKVFVGEHMDNINIALQRILFSTKMLVEQNFAMAIIYEYIGENGTTIVENNPIDIAINQTLPIIGDLQGFLINFRDEKGNLDPNLEFIMIGNLCTILPPDSTSDCVSLGSGPAQNGISSINSFVYKSLSTALTEFESSNRTIQDANNTFNLWYLKNQEAVFYTITIPIYSYLNNQLKRELDNQINSYNTFSLAWTLTTFFCLLAIKIIIWLPINRKLINEIMSLRRIMKIIPKSIIEKNKFYRQGQYSLILEKYIKVFVLIHCLFCIIFLF